MNCPHCQKVIIVKVFKDDGKTDPSRSDPQRSGHTSSGGSIGALLSQIDDSELTGKAAEFIEKTRGRFEKYGERTMLSDPQRSWLEDIASGKAGRSDDWS